MRGSTFITGIFRAYTRTGAEPRSQFGAKTVQIYAPGRMFWSKKGVIIRNAPYTIEAPHLGQIQARINFGEVARRHKGEKGFRDGLPIIAWHIRNEIKDKYKAPDRMRPEEYPSKIRRTVHTLEDLKRMERELRARARVPGPVAPAPLPP